MQHINPYRYIDAAWAIKKKELLERLDRISGVTSKQIAASAMLKSILAINPKIIVSLFICLAMSTSVHSGEILRMDVKLKAGQPWWIIADRVDDNGKNIDTSSQIYMAAFMSAPPQLPAVYARFVVQNSSVAPGKLLVSVSKQQTAALKGKQGVWALTYLPDLGNQQFNIIQGKMEIQP